MITEQKQHLKSLAIKEILDNQIWFGDDDYYAAIIFNGEPVIMTDPQIWQGAEEIDAHLVEIGEAEPDTLHIDGIVKLNDMPLDELEHIAKYKAWFIEEPKIYC